TTNRLGSLLCAGVGGMFMWQILINVGMMLGIAPVIGLTLPLVSYGGTSVVITFASLGLVCGACLRQTPTWLRN
ncbi:MAG: FtsW/RodA/SpoVE family cell cycle protein, partial [Clostridiaceae bacterium]|nr:FtsW/RodA/SpoVE family cell cycle protein [Clostridiaceae bacterium]